MQDDWKEEIGDRMEEIRVKENVSSDCKVFPIDPLCPRSSTTSRSTWWRLRENRSFTSSGCSAGRPSWPRGSSPCCSGSSTSWWLSSNQTWLNPHQTRGRENSKRKCCSKKNPQIRILQWLAPLQVCIWRLWQPTRKIRKTYKKRFLLLLTFWCCRFST